ncbi:12584_t:CDS:10, partial [Acaulospora colombiana]
MGWTRPRVVRSGRAAVEMPAVRCSTTTTTGHFSTNNPKAMGHINSVHRHPRFALSLVVVLLVTALLLLAPRPGTNSLETLGDSLNHIWRPSGSDVYVDQGYNPGVSMWGDLHKLLEYSEGIYQDTIRQRNNLVRIWGGEGLVAVVCATHPGTTRLVSCSACFWDFFIPSFSCPFPVTRVGTMGDGGKWVCGYERVIHQKNCVIYSSGVAQESSFEKAILERSKTCEIYGYDFSVENTRIHFKPWKLQPENNPSASPPEYSLQGLMRKNGHTFIDILKLDIEGSEFDVLDSIFKEYKGRPLPFGQLQLEIHVGEKPFADFLHWWERLEEAGLRPFWTESGERADWKVYAPVGQRSGWDAPRSYFPFSASPCSAIASLTVKIALTVPHYGHYPLFHNGRSKLDHFASSKAFNHSLLRALPGVKAPAGGNWMSGHLSYISLYAKYPDAWLLKVFAKLGHVVRIRGPWNEQLLTTTDLKAIGHVLNNPHIYRKSDQLRWEFTTFIGDGVVVAEGEIHKRQRRIIQQAFGVSQIRDMCKEFVNKSIEVKKEIDKLIDAHNSKATDEKDRDTIVTDMVSWISRAALDIIGVTGFGYDIGSVKNRDTDKDVLYPALEEFDKASVCLRNAHKIMMDIAKTVVDQRTKELERGEFDGKGKDLLTILVKASLEANATKSMTKKEVLNQVPTFLIAAHESTATAVVWTLWSLSNDKAIQNRLREELQEKNFDHPTMEDLNSMTYLDWVVRETLRLHSVGAFLERAANEDDVLPFDTPFVDKEGNTRTELPQAIPFVSIPSRWENPPKITENIPGIWGNQVSFLTGPKACLGF